MNAAGGTEVSDHETEMCPEAGRACVVTVLLLLGAHLFFSALFTAVLALCPALALMSVWTYVTILPFALLAVLCLASHVQELRCATPPAIASAMLCPFINWYARTACQSNYFAFCLLLLCFCIAWLLQAVNGFFENVAGKWFAGAYGENTLVQAIHLSYKSVVYFMVAPLCADLIGIIYRGLDSENILPYIIDNLSARNPVPLALLHYGGLVFTLFFQSAIAVSMAYIIIRYRNNSKEQE